MMDGPEGNYAWWTKMRSGKHHLTSLRDNQIYPACAPDVWWHNGNRRGWDVIIENPFNVPENACEVCQRYVVLWGML
jgi:hypothetical protein